MATNPVLDGVEVTLSGYLIPAPQAADGKYFGCLVPQVTMLFTGEIPRVMMCVSPDGISDYRSAIGWCGGILVNGIGIPLGRDAGH